MYQAPVPSGPAQRPERPPKKWRRSVIVLGVVIAICGVAGLVSATTGGNDDLSEAAAVGAAETSRSRAPAGPVKAAAATRAERRGIGGPVRDGKFEFRVTDIKYGATRVGNGFTNATAQGQFCLITVRVRNIGKEARTLYDGNQEAYDAKGAKYAVDTVAGMYANEDNETFLNRIDPGNEVSAVLVYDIPMDIKLTKLELHDSPFSGGVDLRLS